MAIFKNNFLTEHINRRLTIIQIVIIVYNSQRRKTKKFHKAFDQLDQFLTNLKLSINTPQKIYSLKAIITGTTSMEM